MTSWIYHPTTSTENSNISKVFCLTDNQVVETRIIVKDMTASPEALGAMLLGWLAILLSLSTLKIYALSGMVLATIFFAGFGFLLVAYMGWKKGSLFTLFAFGAIAVFAWSFASLMIMPRMGLSEPPTVNELASFMIVFASLVGVLAIITLKMPCRLLSITIFFASILFFLVGLQIYSGNETLGTVAGWWGLFVGVLAMYLGSAITLNDAYGRMVVPLMICMPKTSSEQPCKDASK
jgi:succinate-acetate transporter protein